MSKNNPFNEFKERHPILLNSILIVLAIFLSVYIALLFMDVFTSHGQQRRVPDVRFMSFEQAVGQLESAGFKWEISDSSTYSEQFKPGQVIDQDPKPGSQIKAIRSIFLKVNAMHPRMVSLPKLQDMSVRQAQASLKSLGFKHILIDSVASPYAGLVLQAKVNGKPVSQGSNVSVNSQIHLTVGDGSIDNTVPDSILSNSVIDSIEEHNFQEAVKNFKNQKDD